MAPRRSVVVSGLLFACAATVAADTKVVQESHQDSFTMMGQTQPARDDQHVMWIGTDRMRVDRGSTSIVVRLDQNKMYIIDHQEKTSSTVDLPLDLAKYLPAGMGAQMLKMMELEATVTPRSETRTVGSWTAHRYDVAMTSQMVTVEATYWATTDVDVDVELFYTLYEQMLAAQPGMATIATELRKIDGFIVEQQSVMRMTAMSDTAVRSTQTTTSVEKQNPPQGTYDTPVGYQDRPFDLTSIAQRQ